MRKKYKAVIFDLDGTLLDTLDDLKNSTNYALREMGFAERTQEEIRRFVGNGVAKLIERAVPEGTDVSMVQKTLSVFKEHYALHCEDCTAPYEDVLPMLARLSERGIALAVVSNKIESAVISLCRQYFEGIDIALGDREERRKKPYPDALFEALRRLGLAPEEAVYIGDSEVDVETAKNAGMDCISVTWGFRDTDALKRAWNVTDNTDLFAENGFSSGEITAYFASSPKEVEKILKIADE